MESVVFDCPYHLCTNPRSSICSKACFDDPCDECEEHCIKHSVGIPRTFNENENIFTIVTRKAAANRNSKTINLPKQNCIFIKYANIPKNCQVCQVDLKDHKVFHFRCKFCRFQFVRIKDSVSITNVREKRKLLKQTEDDTCSVCFKIFNRKADRIIHEKTVHSSEKLKCDVCDRAFQSEKTLAKHTKVYHSDTISEYQCDACGKSVSTQDILNRHKKTVHQEKFFSCEECGLKCSRENHLNRHMSEVHGIVRNINLDFASAEFQKFKRFKCAECGKAFTRKETMRRHKSTVHSESSEVLIKCRYCDKAFGRIDSGKRHEVVCKNSPMYISQSLVEGLLDKIFREPRIVKNF